MQLRFRDIEQFALIKELAGNAGLSVNEWIVRVLESDIRAGKRLGSPGDQTIETLVRAFKSLREGTEAVSAKRRDAVAVESNIRVTGPVSRRRVAAVASDHAVLPTDVAQTVGDKRCKHGFPTCNACGFKDGAKAHG